MIRPRGLVPPRAAVLRSRGLSLSTRGRPSRLTPGSLRDGVGPQASEARPRLFGRGCGEPLEDGPAGRLQGVLAPRRKSLFVCAQVQLYELSTDPVLVEQFAVGLLGDLLSKPRGPPNRREWQRQAVR